MPSCARFLPLIALSWLLGAPANALTFDLDTEFDDGTPGSYATVQVDPNGDDLDFTITLNGTLGPDEDIHELYFNLAGSFTGLAITASNAPTTAYALLVDPSIAGGAGSDFDFGVNFGNGGGPPGNGSLALATFTLSADQALSPVDLLVSSSTSSGIVVHMALHIQGTDTPSGSETVGGVPEPSTALLGGLTVFLAALRARSR